MVRRQKLLLSTCTRTLLESVSQGQCCVTVAAVPAKQTAKSRNLLLHDSTTRYLEHNTFHKRVPMLRLSYLLLTEMVYHALAIDCLVRIYVVRKRVKDQVDYDFKNHSAFI